jgi:hypothetical protein
MTLALAATALVVVPTVQARSTTFSPQGRAVASSARGQQLHGVASSLYRRLPSDDQAQLAGTGSIGGYAAVVGTSHGVPTSLYRKLPPDDQAQLAGTGSIGGYASDAAQPAQPASSGDGFDWTSVVIGAGTGLAALALLAFVSASALSRRRGLAHA